MKNAPQIILAFGILLIQALGCKKEPFDPIYDVHPDFQSLVDSFIVEAANRGVALVINNLRLQYDPDLPGSFCGQCNSRGSLNKVQKEIGINRNIKCWEHNLELEALIFHELGHCILNRPHDTDTLPNGDPRSLMVEGNINVYAPCRYVFGPDTDQCNFLHKREYYLDELFDPQTPIPQWAK